MTTRNVYPKVYLSIYKALIAPIPFTAFNERVQSVLATMQEYNLINITENIVIRNESDSLDKDFIDQLGSV